MDSKGSGQRDGPVWTSDRPRRRASVYGRPYIYYSSPKQSKTRTRTAASQIAKVLRTGNRPVKTPAGNSVGTNLRRSARKRRVSINLEDYTDSSGEDDDLMTLKYRSSRNRINNIASRDELLPRREGLRPRRGKALVGEQINVEYDNDDDEEEDSSSEQKVGQDDEQNGKDSEDSDADNDKNEDGQEGDREDEGEGEDEGEEGEEGEEEEQEGRRCYDLRNRADVRRRSPQIVLQQGMGTKVSKRGGPRRHKRHRHKRAEDSDDSLLVDELDQGPVIPWGRGGSRAGPPWLFSPLDMHGTSALGLNAAASGWGHQSDAFANSASGIQTAGPSSKGGADIQPLQVDERVSFDDIGGLSVYVNQLKEMVFFPLLYPEFFANYHITPPRGVLLCGHPGTGKTLIARALACAASKAGQKVSFYMRKGADVLSKWVGEAERQLRLLFEEAQRNQPSIIFFDEIDGLAPVRSGKSEQIHNSIVSTLLALMDGLDSRGQVVLIGATNRIDAIDGALRRPGRFDREFNFPLPGCEARAEILDIHTRKWKQPPSKELKSELAASSVGYCGADLKALCTEAAICAFREKYPQVYTSDDKFVIDVDSVEVEKVHFIEAMSAITPAAHRGSVVQSRPLSSVVEPCLRRHFQKSMSILSDIFPTAAISSELSKLSYGGSVIPLVYRPRLLLCGGDGVGLDHLGPAILHELEKFPVHSLGLVSLLLDPSAKTPEEAMVHIFGEARRTTPSILYLPQFNLWWENAHGQLRAVLLTLLEELPSDIPILVLGTSSVPFVDLGRNNSSVFPEYSVYGLDKPKVEDRSIFFDRLIEVVLSTIPSNSKTNKSQKLASLHDELPKAPKVDTGLKASEVKAKAEAQGHALRRLRMCLRDICNWILHDKRFRAFHYPVTDEDAPHYRSIIQNPMDMATLLQNVDCGKYITCKAFLEDFGLIASNAKRYNGDDYSGARIVSRAYELGDVVRGMLSQVDPALIVFCEKIAEDGGPVSMPDDDVEGPVFQQAPVVQMVSVTRASARLHNVKPEVNLDQSYEALKRSKKNVDATHAVSTVENGIEFQELVGPKSQEPEVGDTPRPRPDSSIPDGNQLVETSNEVTGCGPPYVSMSDADSTSKIESLKQLLVERTEGYGVSQLERLYARLIKGVSEAKTVESRDIMKPSILSFLFKFAEDEANFLGNTSFWS